MFLYLMLVFINLTFGTGFGSAFHWVGSWHQIVYSEVIRIFPHVLIPTHLGISKKYGEQSTRKLTPSNTIKMTALPVLNCVSNSLCLMLVEIVRCLSGVCLVFNKIEESCWTHICLKHPQNDSSASLKYPQYTFQLIKYVSGRLWSKILQENPGGSSDPSRTMAVRLKVIFNTSSKSFLPFLWSPHVDTGA